MLLSAVSVLVVAQSSSEIPEGLMNNPVYLVHKGLITLHQLHKLLYVIIDKRINKTLNIRKPVTSNKLSRLKFI